MTRRTVLLPAAIAILAWNPAAAIGQEVAAGPAGVRAPMVAFVGVRLAGVPPGEEEAERSGSAAPGPGPHTVLVRNGVIEAIGPAGDVEVPSEALRVAGGDTLYLSPGLVDTHVHLEFDPATWLPSFLLNSVTTVVNLRGRPAHLELRRRVAAGRVAGPAIVTSGSYANMPAVSSPAEARRTVEEQTAAGYDLVKIHGNLSLASLRALAAAGDSLGLAVGGHIPRNLTAAAAIQAGQDWVAHAEEVVYTGFEEHDTAGVGELVAAMAERGVALTPTLWTFRRIADQWGAPAVAEAALAEPLAAALPDQARRLWGRANPYTRRGSSGAAWARSALAFQQAFVRAAAEAGVPIMTGTDSPVPVMFPGASLIDEMHTLVEAGLPRSAVWRAATEVPGRFLTRRVPRIHRPLGVVGEGALARLVLVRHDPVEDFDTYRRPVGVLVDTRWYGAEALDGMRRAAGLEPQDHDQEQNRPDGEIPRRNDAP